MTPFDTHAQHLERITGQSLKSKSRKAEVVVAKAIFCVVERTMFKREFQAIGEYLGIVHASVIHHCRKHSENFAHQPLYFNHYNTFVSELSKTTTELLISDLERLIEFHREAVKRLEDELLKLKK